MSMKVLIVDDDPDLRRLLTIALEKVGGMETESFEGGPGIVEVAARGAFDVVLLDVMMPELDGPQCFELLRADPRTTDLPVVFLTAKGDVLQLRELARATGHEPLSKPFDPITLHEELRARLGRS